MGFGSKAFWSGFAQAVVPVAAAQFGGPLGVLVSKTILGRVFAPSDDDDEETTSQKGRQLELYVSWVELARELDGDDTKTNGQKHFTLWSQITDDLGEFYGRTVKDREIGVSFYNALSDAKADFD